MIHLRPSQLRSFYPWMPYVVLFISLILMTVATHFVSRMAISKDRVKFEKAMASAQDNIHRRLESNLSLLRSGSALFNAIGVVKRQQFRRFADSLQLKDYYPGAEGIGFAVYRRPEGDQIGSPQDQYPVLYFESSRSRQAEQDGMTGYDMAADPVLYETMRQARDTGKFAASGKVLLRAEDGGDPTPGFVVYLPIYEGLEPPATAPERRERLIGFVYIPFQVSTFLKGVSGKEKDPRVAFVIYDGKTAISERLLYRSGDDSVPTDYRPRHKARAEIVMAGRSWLIEFTEWPESGKLSANDVILIAFIGGILLSLSLFAVTRGQVRGRQAAERNAENLRRSEEALKRANIELKRLNKMKSEFTSMISHELRTPLSAIKEGIDLTLDEIEGPLAPGQRETLGIAKSNVDRLARMINNILDFSRLESGLLALSFDKVNLNRVVQEVCQSMALSANKRTIELDVELPQTPVIAECDADKIKQVLINLLDNAIKFTPPLGKITCSLEQVGSEARMSITDSGIGIKPEDQAMIFEMYQQANHLKTTRGAGVGLTICKKVIEKHRGRIELESALGKGSRFTAIIPLVQGRTHG